MKRIVSLSINGKQCEDAIEDNFLLVDFLRETKHLTGTKKDATAASVEPARFWSTGGRACPASLLQRLVTVRNRDHRGPGNRGKTVSTATRLS